MKNNPMNVTSLMEEKEHLLDQCDMLNRMLSKPKISVKEQMRLNQEVQCVNRHIANLDVMIKVFGYYQKQNASTI